MRLTVADRALLSETSAPGGSPGARARRAREVDREDVHEHEHGGPETDERLAPGDADADRGRWRNERDGDHDADERRRDAAGEADNAGRASAKRDDQREEVRGDPLAYLANRGHVGERRNNVSVPDEQGEAAAARPRGGRQRCRRTPRANISSSSTTVPTLADIAGPTSGAMTIEPTTTAGESSSRPAVATSAQMTVMSTYVDTDGARSAAFEASSSRAMRSPSSSSSYSPQLVEPLRGDRLAPRRRCRRQR